VRALQLQAWEKRVQTMKLSVCVSASSLPPASAGLVVRRLSAERERSKRRGVCVFLSLGRMAYAVNGAANLPAAIPLGPPCVIIVLCMCSSQQRDIKLVSRTKPAVPSAALAFIAACS